MDIPAPAHDRQVPDQLTATLREALNALLDFTGASAGWIGLLRPDGRLHFPVRAGTFADSWLTLQQGQGFIWGFEVRDGPTIFNHPPLAMLGNPPLRNLLSCWLRLGTKPAGQLVLANKSNGFTSQDATALHTMALFLSQQLVHESERIQPSMPLGLLYRVLDRVREGILIVDHTGRLVFANASWADWTGYRAEELCNRLPPFPFWVGHAQLAALADCGRTLSATQLVSPSSGARTAPATAASGDLFPFRHRNHSLFWCQMETATAEIAGQAVTIAFLRRVPAAAGMARGDPATPPGQLGATPGQVTGLKPLPAQSSAENPLTRPFRGEVLRETEAIALLLRPGEVIDLWDERWERLTGLQHRDVAGIGTELFLDWLFPRQHDRSFVADLFHQSERRGAQALLEVAGRTGNRSLHFTFLPVRALDFHAIVPTTGQGTQGSFALGQAPAGDAWLIVACPGEAAATGGKRGQRSCKVKPRRLGSTFVARR